MDNRDRGLTSIIALQANSSNELVMWSEDIGGDVVLLLDGQQNVYNQYRQGGGRPQYVVIDADMTIMLKTNNQNSAEMKVLELLE